MVTRVYVYSCMILMLSVVTGISLAAERSSLPSASLPLYKTVKVLRRANTDIHTQVTLAQSLLETVRLRRRGGQSPLEIQEPAMTHRYGKLFGVTIETKSPGIMVKQNEVTRIELASAADTLGFLVGDRIVAFSLDGALYKEIGPEDCLAPYFQNSTLPRIHLILRRDRAFVRQRVTLRRDPNTNLFGIRVRPTALHPCVIMGSQRDACHKGDVVEEIDGKQITISDRACLDDLFKQCGVSVNLLLVRQKSL